MFRLLSVTVCLLLSAPVLAQYPPDVAYQPREGYSEGLLSRPVSNRLSLLSAEVLYREGWEGWGDRAHLSFHLPEDEPVFLTVQTVKPRRHYYKLDRVKPAEWRAGSSNSFSWPTNTVLKQVRGMKLGDLGAVVRLGREEPGNREVVAPAVLYGSRPPVAVDEYRFYLVTNGNARVGAKIYEGDSASVVWQRPEALETVGKPFRRRPRYWGDDPKEAWRYANVADQTAKATYTSFTIHKCEDGHVHLEWIRTSDIIEVGSVGNLEEV